MKQKPECRLICNQNDDDNFNSVFTITDEVAKCLIRAKRDYSAKSYIDQICDIESVEEVLRLSLGYVNFIFVYEF